MIFSGHNYKNGTISNQSRIVREGLMGLAFHPAEQLATGWILEEWQYCLQLDTHRYFHEALVDSSEPRFTQTVLVKPSQ